MFAVKESPVNQKILRIWGGKGCVFLFPQSGCGGIDLPRRIGFGEREIYILAK